MIEVARIDLCLACLACQTFSRGWQKRKTRGVQSQKDYEENIYFVQTSVQE